MPPSAIHVPDLRDVAMVTRSVRAAALLAACVLAGCNRGGPPKDFAAAKAVSVTATTLSAPRSIRPQVQFREATLTRDGVPMRVWYYAPEGATGKLPLVLVPPAGSTLIAGMDLGDGDRAE